ncbi:hypothetical protein [Cohnella sp. WQ 127256]|uniref:hypothetical protein n=1 Tax=Cohnella sp. WQ 127256 TaxID=2938790 RepID=UPI0021180DD0|nr:hypothetical protein [Cohnella sp. WQ 127256]
MKIKHLLFLILISSLIFPSKLSATSWANQFVVWHGYAYVVSDEYVTEIGSKIGHVTKYSDMATYTGNFSNAYKKGTNYYSIKGISTDAAIAVQHKEGTYKKAIRNGKFEGENKDNSGAVKNWIVISLFAILGLFLVRKRYKK